MKMSYALASKYSRIFELMQDPYALIILDYLFENQTYKTVEDLVTVVKNTTKSKVMVICDKMYDLSIVTREYEGSEPTYKVINGRYADFVERIIEIID